MFEKIDSGRLTWEHGEMPDKTDVERLVAWLRGEGYPLDIRFEGDSDGMTLFISVD